MTAPDRPNAEEVALISILRSALEGQSSKHGSYYCAEIVDWDSADEPVTAPHRIRYDGEIDLDDVAAAILEREQQR